MLESSLKEIEERIKVLLNFGALQIMVTRGPSSEVHGNGEIEVYIDHGIIKLKIEVD